MTAGYPWQRITIDLVGPLPSTARGNCYMSVTDYFSKRAEAFAFRNADAKTVTNVICSFLFFCYNHGVIYAIFFPLKERSLSQSTARHLMINQHRYQ